MHETILRGKKLLAALGFTRAELGQAPFGHGQTVGGGIDPALFGGDGRAHASCGGAVGSHVG